MLIMTFGLDFKKVIPSELAGFLEDSKNTKPFF